MGDHDDDHIRHSYRDAVAYFDAVRDPDGRGMTGVLQSTPCNPCSSSSLGQLGARLGDRTAARRAADQALSALAQEQEQ